MGEEEEVEGIKVGSAYEEGLGIEELKKKGCSDESSNEAGKGDIGYIQKASAQECEVVTCWEELLEGCRWQCLDD